MELPEIIYKEMLAASRRFRFSCFRRAYKKVPKAKRHFITEHRKTFKDCDCESVLTNIQWGIETLNMTRRLRRDYNKHKKGPGKKITNDPSGRNSK